MFTSSFLLASLAASATALSKRQSNSSIPALETTIAPATYDGSCFYPRPTEAFDLDEFLGRWYQVAGTAFGPTAGCNCIFADYALNENGTVNVQNGCSRDGSPAEVLIEGTGTPLSPRAGYGASGVLRVQFPGPPPPDCPGPNYIVQAIGKDPCDRPGSIAADDDDAFAIVQANNFTTLFLLSRNQNPSNASVEAWLELAGELGTDLSSVDTITQAGCEFP